MSVVTQHLQDMINDPEAHAEHLKQLQETFGPALLPMRVLRKLKDMGKQIQTISKSATEASQHIESLSEAINETLETL